MPPTRGQKIEVTGVITKNNEEYRLLPRYQNDIKIEIMEKITHNNQEQGNNDNNKEVSGKKNNTNNKYIIVTLIGLSLMAGNIIYRNKKTAK